MIALGSDHAGYELKVNIKNYLEKKGLKIEDVGTFNKESCDYPIYAKKVANLVSSSICDKGILVCGSGIGVSISANKVAGVRAALCYEPELAILARKHNDANVLCLSGRFTDFAKAIVIVDNFLNTSFEGGRHLNRVKLIEKV